jgi:OmpA-OmpF porin, OOP family
MGTSMTMETGAFIEGLRSLITTDVVAKASSAFGESEASVTRGLTAALPMMIGALAVKADDRSLMNRIFEIVQDPASEGSVRGNISTLLGSGSSTTPGVSLGNRFMSLLFGSRTESLGRALSNFAGVRPSTASSMLRLAAPLALGYLGRTVRKEGLDASGLSNMLLGQRNAIMRLVPATFWNVLGVSSQVADTVVRKASPWRRVVPLLLVLLALLGLVQYFR